MIKKIDYKALVFFTAIVFLSGFVGSFATFSQIETWYAGINKPSFNPPNWIFGPVWTTLYFLMVLSSYLIYTSKKKRKYVEKDLNIFYAQLFLNSLWSVLFFGFQQLLLASIEIIILNASILWMILEFKKVNKKAAYLQIPYFLWACFATILTLSIYALN